MLVRASLALLFTLAACSDDSSSSTPDAATQGDAGGGATVTTVTCPATPAATISAKDGDNTAYMPSTASISVGQVVKFTMPSSHNVEPNTLMNTDPGLKVNLGETKCLMFTKAGTYAFYCVPHGFKGSVTVQ